MPEKIKITAVHDKLIIGINNFLVVTSCFKITTKLKQSLLWVDNKRFSAVLTRSIFFILEKLTKITSCLKTDIKLCPNPWIFCQIHLYIWYRKFLLVRRHGWTHRYCMTLLRSLTLVLVLNTLCWKSQLIGT